jgi:hypothetical protein
MPAKVQPDENQNRYQKTRNECQQTLYFDHKKMPVVLGEVDVLKSILLPGVTNAGEGASDLMYGAVEQTRT